MHWGWVVRSAGDSAEPGSVGAFLPEDIRLSGIRSELFFLGIAFGVPAGVLEEIGWTGYAFPKMRSEDNALAPAIFILLGLLWSAWHLPVVNYLRTATPHGSYWFAYFVVFTASMTAMRVLISWTYVNTKSVLMTR